MKFWSSSEIMGKFTNNLLSFLKVYSRDESTNKTVARQLDLQKRYEEFLKDTDNVKYAYCVINKSHKIPSKALRVSTNLFGEFKKLGPAPIFYITTE